ncbi:SPOSA6832_02905, partial [Sporobolomyces salmonicolor]
MDQRAFRQLLETPARSPTGAPPRTRFGQPPPKRTAAPSAPADSCVPPRRGASCIRSQLCTDGTVLYVNKPKKAPEGQAYRDRAAERRQGKDGDFAEAEKLLEDFKARAEGTDKATLEEQMKYLGGDATHSILVKGLDLALLERMKHEQAKLAEQSLEDVEDELDRALNEAPVASSSTSAARAPVPPGKSKSRDELLAELKAMRGGAAGAVEGQKDSRFKPIGAPAPSSAKGKGKEVAAGWKAVGASASAEGEKKRKKKKKVVAAAATPSDAVASSSSAARPSPATDAAPLPPPAEPAPEFDSDDDIFGDAGSYKGFDSDSDSDSNAVPPPQPSSAAPPALPEGPPPPKRKWFDDGDEEDAAPISTAPTAVTDLAAKQAAAAAAAAELPRSRRKTRSNAAGDDDHDDDADADGDGDGDVLPMRLEPLAGSAVPSVRDLLAMDAAAEKDEQRKAVRPKKPSTSPPRPRRRRTST